MALRNLMRTKTWSFEKTTFPVKFGEMAVAPRLVLEGNIDFGFEPNQYGG